MKKTIIIINGTGGSGKDTFVQFCSEYARVANFSSIDKIKEIAALCGWTGGKSEKDREFLSNLKALVSDYSDLPFHSTVDTIDHFKKSDQEVLFIHIREPDEIKKVVDVCEAKTLLVIRQGLKNIATNPSDANVNNYHYDYIIKNTSLQELKICAKKFISELNGHRKAAPEASGRHQNQKK